MSGIGGNSSISHEGNMSSALPHQAPDVKPPPRPADDSTAGKIERVCVLVGAVTEPLGLKTITFAVNRLENISMIIPCAKAAWSGKPLETLTRNSLADEDPAARAKFWKALGVYFTLAKPVVRQAMSLYAGNQDQQLGPSFPLLNNVGMRIGAQIKHASILADVQALSESSYKSPSERVAEAADLILSAGSVAKNVVGAKSQWGIALGLLSASAGLIKSFSVSLTEYISPPDEFALLKKDVHTLLSIQIGKTQNQIGQVLMERAQGNEYAPSGSVKYDILQRGSLKDNLDRFTKAKDEIELYEAVTELVEDFIQHDDGFAPGEGPAVSDEQIMELLNIQESCIKQVFAKVGAVEQQLVTYIERLETFECICKMDEPHSQDVLEKIREERGKAEDLLQQVASDKITLVAMRDRIDLTLGSGQKVDLREWVRDTESLVSKKHLIEIEELLTSLGSPEINYGLDQLDP